MARGRECPGAFRHLAVPRGPAAGDRRRPGRLLRPAGRAPGIPGVVGARHVRGRCVIDGHRRAIAGGRPATGGRRGVRHLPGRQRVARRRVPAAGRGRTPPRWSRASAPTRGVHADFGSGVYGGGPIGIPVTAVPAGQRGATVTLPVRVRERPRAVPDPGRGADRGRPGQLRRPARDPLRPGGAAGPTSCTPRTRTATAVAGRLRCRVRPARQRAAGPGRDLRRRRRTVHPGRAGPLRRGRRRPHRPRDPGHRAQHPRQLRLAGPARRVQLVQRRRCRRWANGSGSSPLWTPRSCRPRPGSWPRR